MKTFYRPGLSLDDDQFISLKKARQLMAVLNLEHLKQDGHIIDSFAPITAFDAKLAHHPAYVQRVMEAEVSGFGSGSEAITTQVCMANGAMKAAVEFVLRTNEVPLACAPVSGFHHAQYANGGGFCTFNGLCIAIQNARANGWGDHLTDVLIIDGDAHYGNGTEEIISVQQMLGVVNFTRGRSYDSHEWYGRLRDILNDRPWGLVLYQAGADAHKSDRYGAGYLDDSDWKTRDELVFNSVVERGIPCVWNLAGGYNDESGQTIDLHARTWRTAMHFSDARRAHLRHLRTQGLLTNRQERTTQASVPAAPGR